METFSVGWAQSTNQLTSTFFLTEKRGASHSWLTSYVTHLIFRDEGAGVGHHSDERVEHEDVGEENEEDEEGDGQPGVGGVVQHLHLRQPQHQLEHGHAGSAQMAEGLRQRARCGHKGYVHGHREGQQLQHNDGGESVECELKKKKKMKRT